MEIKRKVGEKTHTANFQVYIEVFKNEHGHVSLKFTNGNGGSVSWFFLPELDRILRWAQGEDVSL